MGGVFTRRKPKKIVKPQNVTSKEQALEQKKYKSYVGDFGIVKTLGTGASCKVKLAFPMDSEKPVAIKIMDDAKPDVMELMNIELEMMAKLNHKNVVN